MKLSKQRRVWIGVLGLALGALFVDRVILGTGVASPRSASASGPTASTTPPLSAASVPSPAGSIADRLETFRPRADPENAPDGFATIASWYREAAQTAAEQAAAPAKFKLGGVWSEKGVPVMAFINGKRCYIGDTIGDARLVAARTATGVSQAAVDLEIDGKTVTVEMPRVLRK